MPNYPYKNPVFDALGSSVYSPLGARIAALEGEVYPLHIGDTWLDPDPRLSWDSLDASASVRPHRYCDPQGVKELLEVLVEKVRGGNRIPVDGPENLLVTAGATGGLMAAATVAVAPGDEMLVLAPYWPLIRGISIIAGATPVEVPLLPGTFDAAAVVSALTERVSSSTAAVYLNTPSNPAGLLLDRPALEAIAEFARAHDLWILSDEVYDLYAYEGDHHSIAEIAPERTLTVFSFSKSYGMAGYRCGYVVGPEDAVAAACRTATYVWYSVPTPSQLLAARALEIGEEWVQRARAFYRAAGDRAAELLQVPPPEGGTFLFLDVASCLDERGLQGFLEDCLDDNLVLAPGASFGADYDTWVRVCFTCAPPEVVERGMIKLARRLGIT